MSKFHKGQRVKYTKFLSIETVIGTITYVGNLGCKIIDDDGNYHVCVFAYDKINLVNNPLQLQFAFMEED